ncbi:methyl-accepting chemotaxis protein [Natrarchaeobaculum aegyptiacum]|uniref:Transducer protein htr35 n=1 Tax=Natrarchaeobaculum aegyptiacum TaxID=745377 RepID=A0A2Z2HR06_9EURY|nr:methyl-accepting chemotaxis protein [Natrarchaeobaculum aegyptiacum]ARS89442.1 transducer protein htr35 [Natrarchaeobaculum aegyptiacum]
MQLQGDEQGELEEALEHVETIRRHIDETDELTTVQHEAIADIYREISELSASLEEVAASSEEVATAAENAREAAERGNETSRAVWQTMAEVVDSAGRLSETAETLEAQMDEIDAIIEIIGDVADETNLLALNAAIQAAKTGSDGQGFGVIADEVKSLATETNEHADAISDELTDLQQQADQTSREAQQLDQTVREASDELESVIDRFDQITETVDEAAVGIGEVASVTDDQAETVEGITDGIESIDQRSERVTEEMTHAGELIDRQTTIVDHLISYIHNLPGMAYRVENEDGWPVMFASDGTERLTGYTREALLSGEVSLGDDIIHDDDADAVWEAVQEALDDRDTFDIAYRITTRRGTVVAVRERGQGVYDDQGNVIAIEGFMSEDSTDRVTKLY